MKFNIYNYANEPVEKELKGYDKEDIKYILIVVTSGDEIVQIMTKDNLTYSYDASDYRSLDFYDGKYVLDTPELIDAWLKWRVKKEDRSATWSYIRMKEMIKLAETPTDKSNSSIDFLIDQLKAIEDVLAADSSGIEYVRSSKFYVGAALLLLNAAKREEEKNLC